MRILTVISGVLIAACGLFCLLNSEVLFLSLAFLVGVVMVVSGILNTISYIISGRGENRLTEASLVEGLVTVLYGFAVLNNQVDESMLTMFFGTWLTLCGVSRFSQSLYVSRFNPKDWAKIVPLAAVAGMLGMVMMMPSLVSAVTPLMLVGGAFICDGLSTLMYAMFMKRSKKAVGGELKAKERAAVRKAEEQAKRKERDRLRSLSKQEREEELQRKFNERLAEEEAIRKAKEEARAAKREAARPASEKTMEFTPAETAEINKAAEKAAEPEKLQPAPEIKKTEAPKAKKVVEVEPAAEAEPEKETAEEVTARPVWQRPTEIPSIRANLGRDNASEEDESAVTPIKFTAVNLEEIESAKPVIEFEKVVIPEFKLLSDEITADRDSFLEDIDKTTYTAQEVDYSPIDLNELVAEPMARPYDPKEATRFTQTLSFKWLEASND